MWLIYVMLVFWIVLFIFVSHFLLSCSNSFLCYWCFFGCISRNDGSCALAGRIAIQSLCAPQCEHSNMVSGNYTLLWGHNHLKCMVTAMFFVYFLFLLELNKFLVIFSSLEMVVWRSGFCLLHLFLSFFKAILYWIDDFFFLWLSTYYFTGLGNAFFY